MTPCRLCEHPNLMPAFGPLPDFFQGTPHQEAYARCAQCGLLQAATRRDDLSPFYERYTVHAKKSATFSKLRHFFLRRAYDDARPPHAGARLLDYGCGDGAYLGRMRERGWDVAGVELSAENAAVLADHLSCEVHTPQSAPASWADAFDKVTLNMVLEHVEAPRALLERAARWLRPGGELYLSIPNIEGVEARVFGRNWMDLDPPRHRTFVTQRHLGVLLSDAGLHEVRFGTASVSASFAGSVHHLLARRCDPRVLAALLPASELWSFVVRDACLRAWARRPERL